MGNTEQQPRKVPEDFKGSSWVDNGDLGQAEIEKAQNAKEKDLAALMPHVIMHGGNGQQQSEKLKVLKMIFDIRSSQKLSRFTGAIIFLTVVLVFLTIALVVLTCVLVAK